MPVWVAVARTRIKGRIYEAVVRSAVAVFGAEHPPDIDKPLINQYALDLDCLAWTTPSRAALAAEISSPGWSEGIWRIYDPGRQRYRCPRSDWLLWGLAPWLTNRIRRASWFIRPGDQKDGAYQNDNQPNETGARTY